MKNFTDLSILFLLLLLLFSSNIEAQTILPSNIYQNTTLTKANSPYRVVYPYFYVLGKLTIEAGVTIECDSGTYIYAEGAPIIANGTIAEPITFTSSSLSPAPGIWYGVSVDDWTDSTIASNSLFNYCNFLYATEGISTETKDTLIVKNSNFFYNIDGISDFADSAMFVDSCYFKYNSGVGIQVGGGGPYNLSYAINNSTFLSNNIGVYDFAFWPGTIQNCIIDSNQCGAEVFYTNFQNCTINNNLTGITGEDDSISYPALAAGGCNFTNCKIDSNGTGAYADANFKNCTIIGNNIGVVLEGYFPYGGGNDSSVSHFINCIFRNNQTASAAEGTIFENCVITNNQTGILNYDSMGGEVSALVIKNCSIDSNNITGIYLQPNDVFQGYGDTLTGNEIKNNRTGLELFVSGDCVISKNDIEDNIVGVQLDYNIFDSLYIYCNKLCGNSSYDFKNGIYNNSSFAMPNNYWCTTDSTIIASHIYDGYDSVGIGIITYEPTDTVGCYLTGCNLQLRATVTNASCDTCHNGTATALVTYGSGAITYAWQTSPVQTTQTATYLSSGTYTVCVSDANGCTACDYSVFVDSIPCNGFLVSAQSFNASCDTCSNGIAWAEIVGGHPPYTYLWSSSPIQNSDTAVNLLPGLYNVCVTDFYGCIACDSITLLQGNCSAYFSLIPDSSVLHQYIATNWAYGTGALKYDWNWGDSTAHDTTAFPSHLYATAGLYNICLTITDSIGCTSTYCNSFYLQRTTNTMIHVIVTASHVTAVNEYKGNQSIYIYPNPATNHLSLLFTPMSFNGEYKIFNLLGQLILSSNITKQSSDIDISNLSNGIYILEIRPANLIIRQKFVKE